MIKVLLIGMTPNHGGLETYMTYIFSNLQGKEFQFYFINTSNDADLAYSKLIYDKGGKVFRVPIPQHGVHRYLTRYSRAKHFFKQHHDFDIVHINAMSINELYWAKAAKKYGIKHVIIQSHNNGVFYYSKILAYLGKKLADYNKAYINKHPSITKLAATDSSGEWMFGKNSKYKIVNIGMDSSVYKYNRNERILLKNKLGLNKNDEVMIITARIEKQKNYPKIIRVFDIMHSKDQHMKLIIVGKGKEMDAIKALVHSYHLDNAVKFLGEVSKGMVSKLLNIGDLMLIPSFAEAVPFSILESQAAGVPAVVSDAIPKEANVTGKIKFLSLKCSDSCWARYGLRLLKDNRNLSTKLKMNDMVEHSKFGLSSFVHNIKDVYVHLINN